MIGVLRGVMTLILLALFIGVVVWAWSGRRKKTFDAMARLALEEDSGRAPKSADGKQRDGKQP
jgi:cbb3-type cytochrome oxidase subunit 3